MTVSTQTVCSPPRLRGWGGVGGPPRVIPLVWREPPPAALARADLPRKRES